MSSHPFLSQDLPVFNLAVPHRPSRVHAIRPDDDLAALVDSANREHERIHVVGAGHGLVTPIDSGLAVLTGGLSGVEVDASSRTARVGAGSRWSDVLNAAAVHGLAPVCGSAPGVGVIGYLLGGGLSPIGRSVGWASEHVCSFEVVTGTGQVAVASATSHPDLFWALRGGNRAPGIVTSVEIDLLPIATFYGGGLYFGAQDAATVVAGYAHWTADLPDSVTSSCALLRLPDLDFLPEPLRGRFVVHVRVAVVGAEEPEALVEPLRRLAPPIIDTLAEVPFAAIGSVHADPVEPMPVLEAGALLRGFDADAAAALLGAAGPDAPAPFAVVEIRHLGGALGRRPAAPDAVAGRDAAFSLFVVSAPVPALFADVVPAATAGLLEALAPWATGAVQPNFVGGLNAPDAVAGAWPREVAARLNDVWRRYDPAGIFTGPLV